jgi:hypothetical protein
LGGFIAHTFSFSSYTTEDFAEKEDNSILTKTMFLVINIEKISRSYVVRNGKVYQPVFTEEVFETYSQRARMFGSRKG